MAITKTGIGKYAGTYGGYIPGPLYVRLRQRAAELYEQGNITTASLLEEAAEALDPARNIQHSKLLDYTVGVAIGTCAISIAALALTAVYRIATG